MDYSADSFWQTVKRLTKEKNLSQEQICQSCNISINTFRHWITRQIYPDALQAYKIAAILNTSVEYLITGTERAKPDTSELEKTLSLALQQLKALS